MEEGDDWPYLQSKPMKHFTGYHCRLENFFFCSWQPFPVMYCVLVPFLNIFNPQRWQMACSLPGFGIRGNDFPWVWVSCSPAEQEKIRRIQNATLPTPRWEGPGPSLNCAFWFSGFVNYRYGSVIKWERKVVCTTYYVVQPWRRGKRNGCID